MIDAYLLQYSGFLNALESLHCYTTVVCLLGRMLLDLVASEPERVRQRADAACRVKHEPNDLRSAQEATRQPPNVFHCALPLTHVLIRNLRSPDLLNGNSVASFPH